MQILTPVEAKKRIEEDPEIILLDVRTKEEHLEQHIPNSIHIPLQSLPSIAMVELPDKNIQIFVYCRSGGRSAKAVKELMELGYKNVYNIGGIMDWPFETSSEKSISSES